MLRTAIHRTSSIIPRILAHNPYSFGPDLPPGPPRIAVCGTDKWAAAEHIVSALLQQPFSSDESILNALRTRWNSTADHKITIAYGDKPEWHGSTLRIPSSFLSQFPFPLQIVEYSPGSHTDAVFWENDVPIISCNPVTSPLPDLPLENPNTVLVVAGTAPSDVVKLPNTLYVDPLRAIQGLAAAPQNVQRYQDDFVASNLPALSAHIKQSLPSSSSLQDFQTQRLTYQLMHALNTLQRTLHLTKRQVDDAVSAASLVRAEFEEAYNRIRGEVLGVYDPSLKPEGQTHVSKALGVSARQMHSYMDKLTWWKMISHIDELDIVVSRVVDQAWCKNLEQQLIFQTGRLNPLQSHFTTATFQALDRSKVIDSPVLQNTLLQISSSPSYALTPSSLIYPIHKRKLQISQYPTIQLHVAAQRATIGMGVSVASGIGIGWAGWLGWLTGSGVDSATYFGLGMLTAAVGIRWGVGKWENAKKNWWGDWKRIGDSLERDLSAALDQVLWNQVGNLPVKAFEGVIELAAKKKKEITELEEEINGIRTDLVKTKSDTECSHNK